jgi:hypothetical protein
MGFLRTIFIIVLIYYILKFIGRLLAPFAIKKISERMNQNFHQREENTKPEGEITVNNQNNKKNVIDDDEGEYISYEEIKDE